MHIKEAFNPEVRKQRRQERRKRFLTLLGGKCVECGSQNNLQFDHIKKKTKSFNIAHGLDFNEAKAIDEVKKCQLLCFDCHQKKTRDNWDFADSKAEHGTLHMYRNKKCRCDECRKAVSDYNKKRLDVTASVELYCKLIGQ
jgi:hypothetical protein